MRRGRLALSHPIDMNRAGAEQDRVRHRLNLDAGQRPSKPEPDASDKIDRVGFFPRETRKAGGIAGLPGPFDADMGRKVLAKFIAQPRAEFESGQTG